MKEGGQLTHQSALARSGDVPRRRLNEETAEAPKVADGEDIHMAMYLSEVMSFCLCFLSVVCFCVVDQGCVVMVDGRRYIRGLVDKHEHLLKYATMIFSMTDMEEVYQLIP